eukprot:5850820-Prymnesium_polylepis.1
MSLVPLVCPISRRQTRDASQSSPRMYSGAVGASTVEFGRTTKASCTARSAARFLSTSSGVTRSR